MERESFYKICRERVREFAESGGMLDECRELIDNYTDEDNLFALGLVDSMSAVELVDLIEQAFDIEIPLDDYDPASFYSMRAMFDSFAPLVEGFPDDRAPK